MNDDGLAHPLVHHDEHANQTLRVYHLDEVLIPHRTVLAETRVDAGTVLWRQPQLAKKLLLQTRGNESFPMRLRAFRDEDLVEPPQRLGFRTEIDDLSRLRFLDAPSVCFLRLRRRQ